MRRARLTPSVLACRRVAIATARRSVLQDTLARMEAHLKDSKRQVELDQWRLTQDTARVQVPHQLSCRVASTLWQAQQDVLTDERARLMQQAADERADIQAARVRPSCACHLHW